MEETSFNCFYWQIIEDQSNINSYIVQGFLPNEFVFQSSCDSCCCEYDSIENKNNKEQYLIKDFQILLSISIPSYGLNENQIGIVFNEKTKKINVTTNILKTEENISNIQLQDMKNVYNELNIPIEDYAIDLSEYLQSRKVKTKKMFYQQTYPGILTIYIPFYNQNEIKEQDHLIKIRKG